MRKLVTKWTPEWPVEFPTVLPDRSTTSIGAENSRRNPQRTASTAAALMIGLALVTLVAMLAAGIIEPSPAPSTRSSRGDYSITAQNNFSPIPPIAADAAAKAPGVIGVSSMRGGPAAPSARRSRSRRSGRTSGRSSSSSGRRARASFAELGADGAIVDTGYAKKHDLTEGKAFTLLTPTGKTLRLT